MLDGGYVLEEAWVEPVSTPSSIAEEGASERALLRESISSTRNTKDRTKMQYFWVGGENV